MTKAYFKSFVIADPNITLGQMVKHKNTATYSKPSQNIKDSAYCEHKKVPSLRHLIAFFICIWNTGFDLHIEVAVTCRVM